MNNKQFDPRRVAEYLKLIPEAQRVARELRNCPVEDNFNEQYPYIQYVTKGKNYNTLLTKLHKAAVEIYDLAGDLLIEGLPQKQARTVTAIVKWWRSKQRKFTVRYKKNEKYQLCLRRAREAEVFAEYASIIKKQIKDLNDILKAGEQKQPTVKAGCFELINTGGFPKKTMQDVKQAVEQAARYLKTSGFGSICKGPIYVTQHIRGGNNLAFYNIADDRVFIRARAKGSDLVRTLLHELGHRYMYKEGLKTIASHLYTKISVQDIKDPASREPIRPGYQFIADSEGIADLHMTVVRTQGNRVVFKDPLGQPYSMDIRSFRQHYMKANAENPNYTGFITGYAATNAEENFAEMFAYYCLGELPPNLAFLFEQAVFDHNI